MDFCLDLATSRPGFACIPERPRTAKRTRGEVLRTTRADRIRAYINAHVADPALSASVAARALGMSVRSLHLALTPTGETFGELVQRRRLAACHALLRRPDQADTIADIAFASGFNSLSSFYRAFRRINGVCPRAFAETLPQLA